MVDWDRTDEEIVTALIEVKVTPQRGLGFERVAERIYQYDEVESLYLMSGGYDLSVTIAGKSMKEVALFVATKLAPIEGVSGTATHFILKRYKDHGVMFKIEEEKQEKAYLL
jgi:DNA-binding Lrp family transcriptional regulator